jgi:hypothetical protein
VRCYTDLGYYWRVELVAKKLLPVLEQQPKLFSSKTSDALKNYSRLLKKVGNERDCAKYEQLIEKLRSNQAIVNAAQVTER